MQFETELRFQVPAQSREAIRRALATPSARTLRLRASYFDTPDRRLAAAGLSLRLRREGDRWVQTLKGPAAGTLHRTEHEVPVEGRRAAPVLDLARHAGSAAAAALAVAIGDGADSLRVAFETDVRRTHRVVRSAGAVVDVAFDVGELIAGARRRPLCELEFELLRGPVDGLLALAARWADRHRLWLDVRSKAERGDRLARGVDAGPAVPATRPALGPDMGGDAALRAIVGSCLAQILPNAADVAAGVGSAEHLHQLRVGLRRARCALRLFGSWSAAADAAWSAALASLFAGLGSARDRDVLAESVLPELRRAGAPLAELPAAAGAADPGDALRSVGCSRLLLDLVGFAQGAVAPDPAAPAPPGVKLLVRAPLRRLRRQLKADAAAFADMDDLQRHRVRRRLKRFRYGLEFASSLHAPGDVKRCLARAQAAQEVLGRYNDLTIAAQMFQALAAQDPRAWFAVGWLRARSEHLVPEAARALRRLAKAPAVGRRRG